MVISGLSSANNNSLATGKAANSDFTVDSKVNGLNDNAISLDLGFVNSVFNGVQRFTENSDDAHILYQLNTGILEKGSLGDVQSEIDTYTKSLPSSNVYQSVYTAPTASFLADLKALKSDAASGNLNAAASDLAQAKLDSPMMSESGVDSSKLGSVFLEGTNNMADYLKTQGYTAVHAKAEAIAITLAFTPALGLQGNLGEPPSDSALTNQISNLAVSAATQDSATTFTSSPTSTSSSSDPMFNIIESLLQSAAISDSASLQTLSLLNSTYGANGPSTASNEATNDHHAAGRTGVSSFA